jgi:hypothetical protein
VQTECINRNFDELTNVIIKIQQLEKDKLLYVAAHHLDQMKLLLPSLQRVSGESCEVQKTYLQQQIQNCETELTEMLAELQALAVDAFEESS